MVISENQLLTIKLSSTTTKLAHRPKQDISNQGEKTYWEIIIKRKKEKTQKELHLRNILKYKSSVGSISSERIAF